jgi:hypothetical protein
MKNKNMSAVVRWVLKDQAEPVIGICVPMFEFPGEGKRIDYMFWAKVSESCQHVLISVTVCGRRTSVLVSVSDESQDGRWKSGHRAPTTTNKRAECAHGRAGPRDGS